MQDRRNCDRSYGDRIYLHEGCAGWKNLSGSGVGVSHYVFLLKGKDSKNGRNGNGINSFDMNKKNKVEKKAAERTVCRGRDDPAVLSEES